MSSQLTRDWELYRSEMPRWARAAQDVRSTVRGVANAAGIPAVVTGREKNLGEFARKALRKGYTQPYAEITDKAGVRAVVEREDQVDLLLDAVHADPRLQVVEGSVEDKRGGDPDRIQYSGVHLAVIAPYTAEDPTDRNVEVQLRTAAQDVWSSVVSHRLLCKQGVDLRPDLQRGLMRLAVLMELFDGEVSRFSEEVRALAGVRTAKITTLAEKAYLSLLPPDTEWDRELSSEIVRVIDRTLPKDVDGYVHATEAFLKEHEAELALVLADYGHAVDEPHYVLFQQPEIVLLFERLTTASETLLHAWTDARLPTDLLSATADVLGVPVSD